MRNYIKLLILMCIGGAIYSCIEIAFRGYTHISMVFVGGIAFAICGAVNENLDYDIPLQIQMLLCACIVTDIEFFAGVILNICLNLNVWDYSNQTFNLHGQICLLFSVGWYFLSLPAIILDDIIRWKLFKEEKPHYTLRMMK